MENITEIMYMNKMQKMMNKLEEMSDRGEEIEGIVKQIELLCHNYVSISKAKNNLIEKFTDNEWEFDEHLDDLIRFLNGQYENYKERRHYGMDCIKTLEIIKKKINKFLRENKRR